MEKGRVATTPFSVPVQILINASKVLEGTKNKKEVENDLLSIMAPLNDERCSYYTMINLMTVVSPSVFKMMQISKMAIMNKTIFHLFWITILCINNLFAQQLEPIQLDRPDQTETPAIVPSGYI